MLFVARSLRQLQFGKLMEVYTQSNLEKAANGGILRAEQDFYQYLSDCFFAIPDAIYALWEENGNYISALRLEPYKDGLLLSGLETAPQHRRKGYAKRLMEATLAEFADQKIYSHVAKRNAASLAVHEKCGFQIISDVAVYIDGSADNRSFTLCRQETTEKPI